MYVGTQASIAPGSSADPVMRRATNASTESASSSVKKRLVSQTRGWRGGSGPNATASTSAAGVAPFSLPAPPQPASPSATPAAPTCPRKRLRVTRSFELSCSSISLLVLVEVRGDVQGRCVGDTEVGHDVPGVDLLRAADPADEVVRGVVQATRDVLIVGEPGQLRSDAAVRAVDSGNRVTRATAVGVDQRRQIG